MGLGIATKSPKIAKEDFRPGTSTYQPPGYDPYEKAGPNSQRVQVSTLVGQSFSESIQWIVTDLRLCFLPMSFENCNKEQAIRKEVSVKPMLGEQEFGVNDLKSTKLEKERNQGL